VSALGSFLIIGAAVSASRCYREVEEVKDAAKFDGKKYYLVKWVGWPSEYNSWEPEEHLENARKSVQKYEKSVKPRRRQKRKRADTCSDESESDFD
jgi:hypothetical protein